MAKKKNEVSILRSSATEYLTFLTATGQSDVNAIYADENVWLSQKMLALLYNVEVNTINYHLQKAFKTGELDGNSVIRIFRITASDGKEYDTKHYNLKAIISVGNKVDSPRAVQFRKWANDPKANLTRLFFARVQNQLHWAIHGETAAEVSRLIGMKMYPGNKSKKPVIRNITDVLKRRNDIPGRTIQVADKGLNCMNNILQQLFQHIFLISGQLLFLHTLGCFLQDRMTYIFEFCSSNITYSFF